jgi:hypothetical protein
MWVDLLSHSQWDIYPIVQQSQSQRVRELQGGGALQWAWIVLVDGLARRPLLKGVAPLHYAAASSWV